MSFIPVVLYTTGIIIFGFISWLLDGILSMFRAMNLANTTDFGAYDILIYLWYAIVIIYLIFGGIWLIRTYTEQQYQQGMF
jgi:hypothetical protein